MKEERLLEILEMVQTLPNKMKWKDPDGKRSFYHLTIDIGPTESMTGINLIAGIKSDKAILKFIEQGPSLIKELVREIEGLNGIVVDLMDDSKAYQQGRVDQFKEDVYQLDTKRDGQGYLLEEENETSGKALPPVFSRMLTLIYKEALDEISSAYAEDSYILRRIADEAISKADVLISNN